MPALALNSYTEWGVSVVRGLINPFSKKLDKDWKNKWSIQQAIENRFIVEKTTVGSLVPPRGGSTGWEWPQEKYTKLN